MPRRHNSSRDGEILTNLLPRCSISDFSHTAVICKGGHHPRTTAEYGDVEMESRRNWPSWEFHRSV